MTTLVDPEQIEQIVGVRRHWSQHFIRAVSAEQTVYILHSGTCKDSGIDLRACPFSLALDRGGWPDWAELANRPLMVEINHGGYLVAVPTVL